MASQNEKESTSLSPQLQVVPKKRKRFLQKLPAGRLHAHVAVPRFCSIAISHGTKSTLYIEWRRKSYFTERRFRSVLTEEMQHERKKESHGSVRHHAFSNRRHLLKLFADFLEVS
jgi:hypothetical protein